MTKMKSMGEEPEVKEDDKTEEPARSVALEDTEFPLDDDEAKAGADDDDDDEPPAKPDRKERRRERGKLIEQVSTVTNENAALRERLAHLEGQIKSIGQQQPKTENPEKDPLDADIENVNRQAQLLRDAYNARGGKMTPEERARFAAEAEQLDNRRIELRVQKQIKSLNLPKAQDPSQVRAQAAYSIVAARHPDVAQKPEAFRYAESLYNARVMVPGTKPGIELLDQVMEDARERFGLVAKPKPTENTRAQFAGPPKGNASAGSTAGPRTFKPTKDHWKMADAAFGYIKDPKKRMQMFISKVIKPEMAAQQKNG